MVPAAYLARVKTSHRVERWQARIVSGTRQVVLAECGTELVGVASTAAGAAVSTAASTAASAAGPGPTSPPDLELCSLYVAAAARGRGVGAALLTAAVGRRAAYLWVFAANPRAQAFYARHGFRPDGATVVDRDTGLVEQRWVRPPVTAPGGGQARE